MIRIDARGLEAPEPFERVMDALCELEPGGEVLLILDREPQPLYRVLARNNYTWSTTHHDDGRFEILIREKEPAAGGTGRSARPQRRSGVE